jgi:SOS response regulatory protein OraA/RecX
MWGNRKIIASLQEKGVPARLINDAVASARQEMTEENAIAILIKKRAAAKNTAAHNVKEKKRIFQSLMGRGFPPGLILNQLGKTAEEDTDG